MVATVIIEYADGDTEVWNVTEEQAKGARAHLFDTIGAPDLIV